MKRILASILLAASLVAGSAYAAISGTARASAQSDNCGSGDWGSASCQVNISGVTGFTANDLIVVVWSRNDDNTDVYPILPSEGGYTQGPYYSTGFAGSLGCSSAWKKATGSETTITPSWDSGASSVQGGRVLAVVIPGTDLDLDALGDSGENEADIASATTSLSSGSASNSTATGLAIAGLCADNLTANDATAYSNGFAEQGGVDGGTTSADAWIATKVLSSAASQSTAATITNDQGYGAILVFNAAGGTCPATCAGGRSARCITDISDASDPDNLLYGLTPSAAANEDTACFPATSVLGHTVNVTAAGWPSIASGGSQLTDSFDYCIMDDAAACGTDGTYEVTFQPVITSVTGTGTGQTTADITVTPSGPTEGTVQSVAISKTSYDTYGAPSHAQIAAGVDANYDGVSWGSEFTSDLATPDVWTNLLKYSADIRSTADAGEARPWLYSSATVTSNTTTAPDGQTTADTITASATWGAVYQAVTLGTSTTYTLSVYTKPGTTTTSAIALYDTVGADFQGRVNITWTAGVPSTGSTSGTANNITYTSIGDGWYRVSFDTTSDSSNTGHGVYMYADTTSGNRTTVVWGAQLEAAATAGPYTPTVADARARFDGYTFSRASSQTYTKSDGTLGTVTSGNPAFQYSGGTAQGVLLEGHRTNLAKYSSDLSNAVWVASNVTKGSTSTTDPFGNASTVAEVTASAGNGTLLQSITASNAQYTYRVYLKRQTGSGNIDVTVNGGTGWTTCTVTASWLPCSVTATVTNPQVGIRIVTSGDSVFMAASQAEAGPFASSQIPTTSASVTRADTSLTRSWNFPSNNISGQIVVRPQFANTANGSTETRGLVRFYYSTSNYLAIYIYGTSGAVRLRTVIDGVYETIDSSSEGWISGQSLNIRFRKSAANGLKIWLDNSAPYESTTSAAKADFVTLPTSIQLSYSGAEAHVVESLTIWNEAKSDAFLEALE